MKKGLSPRIYKCDVRTGESGYNNNNEPKKEDVGVKRTISYLKIDNRRKKYIHEISEIL